VGDRNREPVTELKDADANEEAKRTAQQALDELEAEHTAEVEKQSQRRIAAQQAEYERTLQIDQLQIQAGQEWLQGFTDLQNRLADEGSKTYAAAARAILGATTGIFQQINDELQKELQHAIDTGNKTLEAEIRARQDVIKQGQQNTIDRLNNDVKTGGTKDTLQSQDLLRNADQYYKEIERITREGERRESDYVLEGALYRTAVIRENYRRQRQDLQVQFDAEREELQARRDALTVTKESEAKNAAEIAAIDALLTAKIQQLVKDLGLLGRQEKNDLDVFNPTGPAALGGIRFANILRAIREEAQRLGTTMGGLKGVILAAAVTMGDFFHQQSQNAGNFMSIAQGAFSNVVNGLGDMAEQYVLTGKTGTAWLRKLVAETLAAITKQAVIKAAWEGAEALAEYAIGISLAANPFTAFLAPPHFAAAAGHTTAALAYAALAGGAGIIGRMVAGNAFNDTSSSGGTVGGGGGTSSGGQQQQTQTIIQNRNQPSPPQQHEVVIRLEPGLIASHLEKDVQNNGRTRELIIRVANS
jgi:hypothetical protein